MSCNGCRILRRGCQENCILRQSLKGIDSSKAQANATHFVAKFFGRSGLFSLLSSVAESQLPVLFQSLLFEACGRMVNPVTGAIGLLRTGHWSLCLAAVEIVLRGGGTLRPLSEEFIKLDLGLAAGDSSARSSRMTSPRRIKWLKGNRPNGKRLMKRSNGERLASPSGESEMTTTFESGCMKCHQDLQGTCDKIQLLPLFN